MAKKLQILRGTTAQNDAYTGSIGELTMDTEKVEVRIHDGITQGGKKIGSGGGASLPILTNIWSDHLLNDMSWLRADTFSWHSGDVYVAAYEHLAKDVEVISYIVTSLNNTYYRTPSDDVVINGTQYYAWTTEFGGVLLTTSATPQTSDSLYNQDGTVSVVAIVNFVTYIKGAQTETIGDITITYYLAQDGHKICLPDQESNIVALYEATGVAWYYILDTANKQFKLPRSKHNKYADTVPVVGTGKSIGFTPVGKAFSGNNALYPNEGAIGTTRTVYQANTAAGLGLSTDPNLSEVFAQQAQDTDQYKYLYFYVGNYTQEAVEQTAGINAEMFNDLNAHKVIEFQAPTADNNYTWYRKYKSGWVEQGGSDFTPRTINAGTGTSWYVTMPVPMSDTNYNIQISFDNGNLVPAVNNNKLTSSTQVYLGCKNQNTGNVTSQVQYWQVSGMSA